MRTITGTLESSDARLARRDRGRFPEMASYCAEYIHDETPWCGLTIAYCMAHKAEAVEAVRYSSRQPQLGDVLVFKMRVRMATSISVVAAIKATGSSFHTSQRAPVKAS
jgi:hypothetical protein